MAKLGIKHHLLSEVFFSRKSKPTHFQHICTEIKTTQYCFKIIKIQKKMVCKVSTVKCEQTRRKETKEVCMLLLKRSLNSPWPGITRINHKKATAGVKTLTF